ncbi:MULTISPECIES: 2-dehydro-3-deoxy-phosphogluconate aldolase [Brucella]|uniref:2-dehydro-3-deoxy-phosphogluconate aldolase n=1 Tax=Brucella TaxID=234 RepID=UPI0001B58D5D|nr:MULTISPECIES: 2-dehydro-3-deoxy-phosphogluconate aldolase [Brucella]ENT04907.1 2-dehydro-3-deoxyphosphogluconate aldolase/4-hydroxy-2-oxoglutarate aldolase [Brucella sp. F23/97]ENT13842.1 2-dehydro-3-deoxyphosphogluconate aldolase/4-hydroxy-2-oxoglutarate aldolase [Brucella sp. F96/2]ENT18849.1 2-dehydro-3-deoxyphosphogluconate aldolase/4-hydroxy-2-oxoglutarate aldolase [Brucella sp. UK1/97]KEY01552.1 keto-deoxy-phosphogluconate aldolase [Brucella ceti B1/94]
MSQKTALLLPIMKGQPVIPVLLIDKVEHAVPLARALARGGLPAIEITLRTAAALDAIRAVADEVPETIVGAGTILNAKQYEDAAKAGSRFIVSPGATKYIVAAANDSDVPLLPAAITPGEMLALREEGYTHLKFFPAEQAGGAPFLKALSSPLAGTFFCPTGGISLANARTYLPLPNVLCVGGSWVAPKELVEAGNWNAITDLAKDAAALKA